MKQVSRVFISVSLLVVLFSALLPNTLIAQEKPENQQVGTTTQTTVQNTGQSPSADSQNAPVPITTWPDTFAWRTLTTGTGSFPFTYFFANLGFDLVRFGISGFDASYAPWPFRNPASVSIPGNERMARIAAALGISIIIGLVDAINSKP